MTRNREKLRTLMAEHDIKGPDVARILGREITTVHVWMGKGAQDIPDETLELLEMKLGAKNE